MKTELLLLISYIIYIATAKVYNTKNSKVDFENFKVKYNKNYDKLDEKHKYENFIANMNNIERMNTPAHIEMHNFKYAANKYIDLNNAEMDDQYAVTIPYDQVRLNNPFLRPKPGSIKEMGYSKFYNLHEADNLYRDFLRKYGKTYSELDKVKHYYRFIKTLVELNRHNVHTYKSKGITENADDILEPTKFFS